MSPQAAAAVLSRFRAATSPTGSPRAVSPRGPRVFPRTTNDMLEDLHLPPGTEISTPAMPLSAVQLAKVTNAVMTPVKALPPAIITALEETDAAPFLFFRWLSSCLIEVCQTAPAVPALCLCAPRS